MYAVRYRFTYPLASRRWVQSKNRKSGLAPWLPGTRRSMPGAENPGIFEPRYGDSTDPQDIFRLQMLVWAWYLQVRSPEGLLGGSPSTPQSTQASPNGLTLRHLEAILLRRSCGFLMVHLCNDV